MNYNDRNTYSQTYKINGTYITVKVDFVKDKIEVKTKTSTVTFPLDDFINFEGDMEDFINSKFN